MHTIYKTSLLVGLLHWSGAGALVSEPLKPNKGAAPPKPKLWRQVPSKLWRQELKNIDDLQYYGTAVVGTQNLSSIIDTGFREVVVVSDLCTTWCGSKDHLYHSATNKKSSALQTLRFGSGSLVVEKQHNSLHIGPLATGKQEFWQVVDANMPVLQNSEFAAILGIGPQDPSKPSNAAGMAHNLGIGRFSLCLLMEPQAPGYITWNDDALDKSPHMFVEIAMYKSGFWLAALKNVMLGNVSLGCTGGCGAVVDSGTSLLGVPKAADKIIRKELSKLRLNCNDISALPPLHFELGGQRLSLPPDAYLGMIVGTGVSTLLEGVSRPGCQPVSMPVTINSTLGETWIFGMPFLRAYYTVFVEGEHPKLHVSRATKDCHPSSGQMELYQGHKASIARRIKVARLYLPPWLRKAQARKQLEERAGPAHVA